MRKEFKDQCVQDAFERVQSIDHLINEYRKANPKPIERVTRAESVKVVKPEPNILVERSNTKQIITHNKTEEINASKEINCNLDLSAEIN